MANYIVGGILLLLVILAVRSYFGKKFSNDGCRGCSNCANFSKCKVDFKEKVDKH